MVILNGILEKYLLGYGKVNRVTQDRDQCQDITIMIIKLRKPQTSKMFFLNSLIFEFVSRTLLHGLSYNKDWEITSKVDKKNLTRLEI